MKTNMSKKKFVVIGIGDLVADLIATIDHFPIEPGQCQYIGSFDVQPGGMGNFLIAGARIGMDMTVLGAMGKDVYSETVLAALSAENVKTDLVKLIPGVPSKVVLTLVEGNGKHVFLSYEGGDIESMFLNNDWIHSLESADALLVLGYALNETYLQNALLQSINIVKNSGGIVFFDPGPKVLEISDYALEAALCASDVMLLTKEELALLMSRVGKRSIQELMTANLFTVCVKLGPTGCRIFQADQVVTCPGYRVEVRDTSAAGDSFAAAFIYGILSGWNLAETGVFANAMGAAKVSKLGTGRNVPTLDEIRSIYAANSIQFPDF